MRQASPTCEASTSVKRLRTAEGPVPRSAGVTSISAAPIAARKTAGGSKPRLRVLLARGPVATSKASVTEGPRPIQVFNAPKSANADAVASSGN